MRTVTLEQPDEQGNLLWRLKAETVNYKPGTERADLLNIEGEFFQEEAVIYTVSADEGEVLQNGETRFLRGNLIANGKENDLTLEGERLKCEPEADLLVMGDFEDQAMSDGLEEDVQSDPELTPENAPVKGFNPQIEAIASIVTVQNREKRVDLTGGVVAKS